MLFLERLEKRILGNKLLPKVKWNTFCRTYIVETFKLSKYSVIFVSIQCVKGYVQLVFGESRRNSTQCEYTNTSFKLNWTDRIEHKTFESLSCVQVFDGFNILAGLNTFSPWGMWQEKIVSIWKRFRESIIFEYLMVTDYLLCCCFAFPIRFDGEKNKIDCYENKKT